MTTRMLIDARHAEETRVAVLQGNRIEEFDFESAEHKQIKGNIYLAKVTRVEPSLQAAFVDFGGNRHGFLAFSEIHPDYYQIPKQDREALLAEEAEQAAEEEALRAAEDAEEEGEGDDYDAADLGGVIEIDTSEKDHVATIEAGHVEDDSGEDDVGEDDSRASDSDDDESGNGYRSDDGQADAAAFESADGDSDGDDDRAGAPHGRRQGRARSKQAEELRDRRMALRRRYKIQDVIQRRQVLLVQVVKEERGNKGAALTTYLSLAGRYCVLMPNSSHGGGISRKISSAADRKRLKSIVGELELPRSMGCIVRTAGLARTKTEIKRDFDYLARLWDEIREKTLGSSAPALIHSDSDLIKRAIRDIYNREIEDVVVEGEQGFYAARAFMKLLMPSHAQKVKAYADPVPLFQRYGAEDQLTAMYDPIVQLRSGGYIVINPTEALVSIDINSGRSTKEYGIEATALNTNLEAAREIARQLRLRDMAGLVVIDFIDMEHGSNVRKVEKAMKDALRNDRARIQVGRISGFGLMEMSRQRLRTGVLEASTRMCPHCDGTGLVRTASSAGLAALRLIEDEAAKGRGSVITLFASTEASIYLLNVKRQDLGEIEYRYNVRVEVIPEGENEGAKMRVGSSGPRPEAPPRFEPIVIADDDLDDIVVEEDLAEELEEARESDERSGDQRRDDGDGRRKRRKRRRGRDRDDAATNDVATGDRETGDRETEQDIDAGDDADATVAGREEGDVADRDDADGEAPRKRRRRGRRRRGGRINADEAGENGESAADDGSAEGTSDSEAEGEPLAPIAEPTGNDQDGPESQAAAMPESGEFVFGEPIGADVGEAPVEAAAAVKAPRTRRKSSVAASVDATDAPATGEIAEPAAKPVRTRRKKVDADAGTLTGVTAASGAAASETATTDIASAEIADAKPKRVRRKKADSDTTTQASSDPVPVDVPEAAEPELPAITSSPEDVPPVDAGAPEDASPSGDQLQPVGETEAEDAASPRRGWWQRTFGA